MNARYRLSIAGALLASCGLAAAADPPQVRARLVADSARFEAGRDVGIGVLLEMEPGWHIYWRNPGEAGLATDVMLSLPDGFEAGELRWPTPIRFVQPGDLTGYGYEGSVLLATEVRALHGSTGEGLNIAADVSWLACRDVCVLGSALLEERWPLPVAASAFERWRRELPGDGPAFSVSTTGGLGADAREGELTVWLQWPDPPAHVEFFPETGPALKISDLTVRTRGSLTRVDLAVRVLGSPTDRPAVLVAVVAAGRPSEPRRSWQVSVPISKS